MKDVRIGIIGVGGMGAFHAQKLLDGKIQRARLVAVCDPDPKSLGNFDDTIRKFADSRKLLRSGAVDAVVIATPHYAHTTIGMDALGLGMHTLVEKPISVHKADAERLIAARKDPATVFSAMFNQRTDPHFQKLRSLIQDGELGEITRVNWIITTWFRTQAYFDRGGWRATWSGEGGGVLLNQCPHNLDLLQWLFGMPVRVRAFCGIGKRHAIEVEDEVTAYLEYDNGATGVFITSTGEAPGTNRLEVSAERGKVVVEAGKLTWQRNTIPQTEFLKTSKSGFGRPETWMIDIPCDGTGGQHTAIFQNFVDAILDHVPLIAPAEEGIHSVELANAMLYSSFTERTIELPLDGARFERHLKRLIRQSSPKKPKPPRPAGPADLSKSF